MISANTHAPIARLVLAALLLTACAASHAQRMYRCGNTYQQTPCAGADGGKGLTSRQIEERRNLIAAVYAKRGSAPKIRNAIEADCVKEMEQAEEALALAGVMAKQQRSGANPGTSANATPPASPDANLSKLDASQREANAAAGALQRWRH